jgi:5-methylcytosine-specific restriction endonuclease McrA
MPRHNARYANGHRRRQVRAQVLRDEDSCAICGQPVDKGLPAGQPGSPEVDELIPVSKGGSPYKRENCRLTHRLCNARRGNGSRLRPIITPYTTARQW